MHTNKDNKISTQRNITPNFLKYKRKSQFIQANHLPNLDVKKIKALNIIIQLKEVALKRVDAVLMYIKKEFYISAKSVSLALSRKYFRNQSQRKFSITK
jgi:hypothetical protein